MELSEAKQRLTYINHAYDYGNIYSRDDLEAIDTVLKALDNSISKDEVRKLVEQKVERLIHSKSPIDFVDNDEWTLEQLKKLLGE